MEMNGNHKILFFLQNISKMYSKDAKVQLSQFGESSIARESSLYHSPLLMKNLCDRRIIIFLAEEK